MYNLRRVIPPPLSSTSRVWNARLRSRHARPWGAEGPGLLYPPSMQWRAGGGVFGETANGGIVGVRNFSSGLQRNFQQYKSYSSNSSSSSSSSSNSSSRNSVLQSARESMDVVLNELRKLAAEGSNIPKGFGKFYPKGSRPPASGAAKEGAAKEGAAKEGASKGGDKGAKGDAGGAGGAGSSGGAGKGWQTGPGGAPGGGKPPGLETMVTPLFGILTLGAIIASELNSSSDSSEISWQEFQGRFLDSGQVERIVVVNNKIARIILKDDHAMHGADVQQSGQFDRQPQYNNQRGDSYAIQRQQGYQQQQGQQLYQSARGAGGGYPRSYGQQAQQRTPYRQAAPPPQRDYGSDGGGGGFGDHGEFDQGTDSGNAGSQQFGDSNATAYNSSFGPHGAGAGAVAGGGAGGRSDGDFARRGGKGTKQSSSGGGAGGGAAKHFYFTIGSVEGFERKLEQAQLDIGLQPRDFVPVQYVQETNWGAEAVKFLPTLLIIGVWLAFMRMGSMGGSSGGMNNVFKIGRSNAKKISKEKVNVSFKDVAGVDEAKREIMEFVEFLKNPKKFTDLGAKIPKGALLSGPPGTGKTLLAKATAGEADVPFFTISGSDFIEMFVGVGPSRVRDLFKEARANAPCIVFIDEIDAVGRKRGRGGFSGGNDERENTLNQLLVEMDGFGDRSNIVVLAGTNRADILDPALMRPGRFDRQIVVDRPDIKGRKKIFEVHLKGLNLKGKITDFSGKLAGLTPGFTGADIESLCNEAAIQAARRNLKQVDMSCFEAATDRVIGGLESSKLITPEEKRVVAYHEAGHAVAGWNLEHADPLLKVTIVPRGGGALGFAQYLPKEVFLRTKAQITDIICMALAGRASEQIHFGHVTTGASDDLRKVTDMVYQMISVYGMSERIGQLAFPKKEGGFPGEGTQYSDHTAQLMDEEAKRMVDEAYATTLALIDEKKAQVKALAELLIEKETINHDDIVSTIGPRPFASHAGYQEFIANVLNDKEANENAGEGEDGEDKSAAGEKGEGEDKENQQKKEDTTKKE